MTHHPDDIDMDPDTSLLFWLVIGVVIFWAACFCAGLVYSFFM